MVLLLGVPTAVVLGLVPLPRVWKAAILWLVWFAGLAFQTSYLAHPGRSGWFGVEGLDAVQGEAPAYWLSQPLIAAFLLALMLGIDRLRRRRSGADPTPVAKNA